MLTAIKSAMVRTPFSALLLLLVGASNTLAFAPFHLWPVALLAPAVLFYCWSEATSKRACWQGLYFGIGFFGSSVSWVYISMHRFGGMSMLLAGLATMLFVVVLALFIALQGYLANKAFTHKNIRLLLVYPVVWVVFEWLRAVLFTGFPWVFLGYSQLSSPFAGFAPILGVYGVSLACVFSSAWLVYLFVGNRLKVLAGLGIILLMVLGFGLTQVSWTHVSTKPVRVSLVQGNIPQTLKWDPQILLNTLSVYNALTLLHVKQSDLIIWPENAIPAYAAQITPYLDSLTAMLKQHHIGLIAGMPIRGDDASTYFNGAKGFGLVSGQYVKHHLVPFGEYIPFEAWFGQLLAILEVPMSHFSAGALKQPLLRFNGLNIAVFICYESVYPRQIRAALQGANLMVTLTDDAWFGDSLGPPQHAQMNRMRALETGRYMLNATNNGITDIITPKGQILAIFPAFKSGVLQGDVYAVTGQTPWLRFGLMPLFLLFFMCLVLGVILDRRGR